MPVNYIDAVIPVASDAKFAIIVSRFNSFITEKLLDGAIDTLKRDGQVSEDNITVIRVPGAIEIPLVASKLAKSNKYSALITLGCVIRGSTYHFEVVANECSKGLTQVMLQNDTIIANGVLTVNNLDEAVQRAGAHVGNKGSEAAKSALEMVNILKEID